MTIYIYYHGRLQCINIFNYNTTHQFILITQVVCFKLVRITIPILTSSIILLHLVMLFKNIIYLLALNTHENSSNYSQVELYLSVECFNTINFNYYLEINICYQLIRLVYRIIYSLINRKLIIHGQKIVLYQPTIFTSIRAITIVFVF